MDDEKEPLMPMTSSKFGEITVYHQKELTEKEKKQLLKDRLKTFKKDPNFIKNVKKDKKRRERMDYILKASSESGCKRRKIPNWEEHHAHFATMFWNGEVKSFNEYVKLML